MQNGHDYDGSMQEKGEIPMVGKHEATTTKFEAAMAEMALEAMIAWMAPFDGKFYSVGCLMMFMKLITNPGLKKSEVALFLENSAKISRSTAERYIKDAIEAGHIVVNNPVGRAGLELFLSDTTRKHFLNVFNRSKINSGLMSEIYKIAV